MAVTGTPDLIIQPFATSGNQVTPPQTDPNGFVNFAQGYGPDYELDLTIGNPAAHAVERQIQNYLFFTITQNLQQFQQYGFPQWYATMVGGYDLNAVTMRYNGSNWQIWRSLTAANVTDPLQTGQTTWEVVPTIAQILKNIPMPFGGVGGSSAGIVIVATDFNTFGTGTWDWNTDAIAAGSPNSPSSYAGSLQSMVWNSGSTQVSIQTYADHNQGIFYRSKYGAGAWGSWGQLGLFNPATYGGFVPYDTMTGSAQIPSGSTAQRTATPLGANMRFNSTINQYEGWYSNTSTWQAIGGGATGGGGDQVFYLCSQTVNNSYSIPVGQNAGTFGPITIAPGAVVTIPPGSVWMWD